MGLIGSVFGYGSVRLVAYQDVSDNVLRACQHVG
jgi:hypothetical protein